MLCRHVAHLRNLLSSFAHAREGSIGVIFAIALIPLVAVIGAAIDYSRASDFRTSAQAALDAALLAGAKDGTSNWADVASRVFNAVMQNRLGTAGAPTFQQLSSESFKGTVSATVPTSFMAMMHIPTIDIALTTTAIAADADNSCILTLDHGQPSSHVSLSLNGAPVVNLSGCSIRSNTSVDCNGHDGNITKALATGMAGDCTHPNPNSPVVPDLYTGLANTITAKCGSLRVSTTWTAGSLPTGPGVITNSVGGRTEYHICGDLTVTGSGYLTGSSPSADSVIVIENGSLNVIDGANVTTARTAIVLTGNNSYASQVNFPTGNGQSASLSLSAPTDPSDPWQGVALYQDPKLTYQVDDRWGPGADFNADGLVYLGNANIVTDGNTGSNNSQCSKFVMNSFTTNGHVNLDLQQQYSACSAIGLKQWNGIIVHLTN